MSVVGMAGKTMPELHLGLEGIYFAESSICKVDGTKGRLYYRGYSIGELAGYSDFEEVSYLLLHGELPTRSQLIAFRRRMRAERTLPNKIIGIIEEESVRSHPMHVLLTAVAALAAYDKEADVASPRANMEKSIRLISKAGSIVAAIGRLRSGKQYVRPDARLGHAENMLYMMNGTRPSSNAARLLDLMMVLHAEHSSNASTFSTIVTGATLSDLYSAVASGIATLKGPLHGGADERALQMLRDIKRPENTERYIDEALQNKRRVMGFGHRVYKTYDPRARIIRKILLDLSLESGEVKNLAQIALRAEKLMIERLGRSKGIWPNVDFFTGPVYVHIGIIPALFTPMFAASRMPGWCAHMLEYWEHSRLIRPLEYYTGQAGRRYVPLGRR